jgi:hypothetical protein
MMQLKAEMIPFIEAEMARCGDVIARAKLENVPHRRCQLR